MSDLVSRDVLARLYGHDASHYLVYPSEIRVAASIDDVVRAFKDAPGSSVTFRSGATSLSGQTLGSGIVVDTRRHFQRVSVRGDIVECEPGATVAFVNAKLRRHGRQLGPDPASEIAATIGGVLSNNSSGMACGTEFNTYALLDSLVVTLASGLTIDTADEDADDRLRDNEPVLYAELEAIRDEIRGDTASVDFLRHHFSMKNTIGYGLNSFLDYDRPIDIFARLLVGAEGTLGFVSLVRMRTVPLYPNVACALAVFDSLEHAALAISDLREAGAHTIELMDATSLRVAQSLPDCPREIRDTIVTDQCALLIEVRGDSRERVDGLVSRASQALERHDVRAPFTSDPGERAARWVVRKGLYAACAGSREPGTTALLEDIVVPVAELAATCRGLQELTARYGYRDSVIFGHAKDGNLHFMVTDDFHAAGSLDKLDRFTEDLVSLVLDHRGNLKAEHGTGRAMAPFVERQYGPELTDVMWRLKRAADPAMILNPGVILSSDASAHLRDMKSYPQTDPIVDRCVECGYCEPACPSKNLTLTPRTRIVLGREIELARQAGDDDLVAQLEAAYPYSAVDTCAVDGLCAGACPLSINTGDLVRQARSERPAPAWQAAWGVAARAWSTFTAGAAAGLSIASHLPDSVLRSITTVGRSLVGEDRIPLWSSDIPSGGRRRRRPPAIAPSRLDAIYVPSCLGSLFDAESNLADDLVDLAERAGLVLHVPAQIDSMCCSTPWSSKGLAGRQTMVDRVRSILTDQTGGGRVPVICDASSCTEGFITALTGAGITVLDAPTYVATEIMPRIDVGDPSIASLTLHPTCSSTQLGSFAHVEILAKAIASRVEVPEEWGCCAFAGDRGLLHPELTAAATEREARAVSELDSDVHASSNRTCEIGLARATGETYDSIVSLFATHVRNQ